MIEELKEQRNVLEKQIEQLSIVGKDILFQYKEAIAPCVDEVQILLNNSVKKLSTLNKALKFLNKAIKQLEKVPNDRE